MTSVPLPPLPDDDFTARRSSATLTQTQIQQIVNRYTSARSLVSMLAQVVLLSALGLFSLYLLFNLSTVLAFGIWLAFWFGIIVLFINLFPSLFALLIALSCLALLMVFAVPYRILRPKLYIEYGRSSKDIGRLVYVKGADDNGNPPPSVIYGLWYAWRALKHIFGAWSARALVLSSAWLSLASRFIDMQYAVAPFVLAMVGAIRSQQKRKKAGLLTPWEAVRPNPHTIPFGDAYHLLGNPERKIPMFRYVLGYEANTYGWFRRRLRLKLLYTNGEFERGVFSVRVVEDGPNILEIPKVGLNSLPHQELTLDVPTFISRPRSPYIDRAHRTLQSSTSLVERGVGADAELAKDKNKRFVLPAPERMDESMDLDWEERERREEREAKQRQER